MPKKQQRSSIISSDTSTRQLASTEEELHDGCYCPVEGHGHAQASSIITLCHRWMIRNLKLPLQCTKYTAVAALQLAQ